ncbi:MAG: diaminopimelate decarboxylase [Alphaproteobacteria bacterium]
MTEPFTYRGGVLHAEDVPVADIVAAAGTPVWIYSAGAIAGEYRAYRDALAAALPGRDIGICFAMKANASLAVLGLLARLGAGADVVSGGELAIARAAGVAPERVVFSGVAKTAAEIDAALEAGIHQFNVESEPELEAIAARAVAVGRRARVALRVNPDVDAHTHDKISTGRRQDKFGIDIARAPEVWRRAATLDGVEPVGLAVHIGSMLTDVAPYRDAFTALAGLVRALRAEGHAVSRLDLGGGIAIAYRGERPPAVADYAAVVAETVGDLGCALLFEPGRRLVGNAGLLATRVVYVKDGPEGPIVIVDAGMNELLRPALYDAWHEVLPLHAPPEDAARRPSDVVGPVCESADTFMRGRSLPPLAPADVIAFASAGAYGAVMSSTYNGRPLAPEVLVAGARFAVVRPRQTIEDLIARERVPDWLADAAGQDGG